MKSFLTRHSLSRGLAAAVVVGTLALTGTSADAAGTAAVSGAVFQDSNRNGVRDAGEAPLAGMQLYLYDGAGTSYVGTTLTDANGAYRFGSLSDGAYLVMLDPAAWESWQRDWVPTTTGDDLFPRLHLNVAGSAVADFGIRQIVRATTPISTFTGTNGLRVESYDDVLAAKALFDDLTSGSLIGDEASHVTVRFDASSSSSTTSSFGAGSYTSMVYVSYSSWLTGGDATLFHEYGHAWSMYFASMVQNDTSLSGYVSARGLANDSRVGSSYEWSPREMIAEDYRQLFGTANAKAQGQMNTAIPSAAQVPGLAEYLQGTFRTPATSTSQPSPAAQPAPLSLSAPSVNPQPVTRSGTVTVDVSVPTQMTIDILDANGRVVRTLLSGAARPAGTVSETWDRKNAKGQRVKAGAYDAVVSVVDSQGRAATTRTTFQVS